MKIIKEIVKNILIFIIVLILSYFSSVYFGRLYSIFYISSSIASIDFTPLIGLPLAYLFFLFLLFTAFSDSKKYWWIGVLLIPAALFEVYFDWEHIYIPVIIGVIGWLIGFVIFKIISRIKPIKI